MKVINRRKSPLTICALLCIYVVSASTVWGQEGGSGGGDDGKKRVEVTLNAYQCGSVDRATFTIDGQRWSPSSAGDDCGDGEAGTHTFHVRKGVEHTLRAHAIEAIVDDDGKVSLWWNIWAEDGVLVAGQTPDKDAPIDDGGHPMPELAYSVVAPIVSIRSIAFSGDYQQPLVADPGVTAYYGSPQWQDWDMSGRAGDHPFDRRAPVLFASQGPGGESSRAALATRFSVVPDIDLNVLWGGRFRVRGEGPVSTLSFPPTAVPDCVWGAASQECEAANSLTGAFDKEVALWEQDELQFTWTYTFDEDCGNDDSSCWLDAGESEHLLYVSYKPAADQDEHPLYHSLVHLGCEAAEGASDDESVLNAIWEDGFTPLDVRRVTPEGEKEEMPLTYYGTYAYASIILSLKAMNSWNIETGHAMPGHDCSVTR